VRLNRRSCPGNWWPRLAAGRREPHDAGRPAVPRAASATALPDALLARLATLLAMDGPKCCATPTLRQPRRTAPMRAPTDTRVQARSCWPATHGGQAGCCDLLVKAAAGRAFGRALLAGSASRQRRCRHAAPGLCSCFDVSEARIAAVLSHCTGCPGKRSAPAAAAAAALRHPVRHRACRALKHLVQRQPGGMTRQPDPRHGLRPASPWWVPARATPSC
jgi:assimilatory nitrate reductase catalytic subunit